MFSRERISMKVLLITTVFSSFTIAANAGTSYYPIVYSAPNYGFNAPDGIASDSQGNIWVGNGYAMVNTNIIKIPVNATNEPIVYSVPLISQTMSGDGMVVDRYGNVWRTSFDNETVTEYPASNPKGFITDSGSQYHFAGPGPMATDKKGNIWITNRGSGNGQSSYLTEIPVSNPGNPIIYSGASYGFGQGTIAGITADPQGNIWVINGNKGITELPVGNPNNPIVYSGSQYSPMMAWSPIISDKNGNIWFPGNTANTIMELPVNNPGSPVAYSNKNYPQYVLAMTADSKGNIWLTASPSGFGGSVIELPAANPNNPIVYSGGNYGFDYPSAIAADPSGNIWVANENGTSVSELMKLGSS